METPENQGDFQMANILKREKQLMVLKLLVEGNSIRSTGRITGIHKRTITNLLVRFGTKCQAFLDTTLRNIKTEHIECDEIWTFVRKKQGHLTEAEKYDPTIGDIYLFTAIEQDSKLLITYVIGKRNEDTTQAFIEDLSKRIVLPDSVNAPYAAKPQLSTDGWQSYPGAIWDSFGSLIQYGQIVKNFQNTEQPGRYGPPEVVGADRRRIQGIINLDTICTSHVERNNLTIRTFMKRFTRLALGFSKKLDNLAAAVALHVAYYNFCWRPRENTGGRYRLPPAMTSGVCDRLWKMDDLYDAVLEK